MFSDTVRARRLRMGLSQEELAAKTGVSVRAIANIEAGRTAAPRPATVRLLADAFHLTGPQRDEFCQAAARSSTPEASARTSVVPAQLPWDVYGFAGRVEQLARLDALVSDPSTQAVVITAVSGMAGVGKTALAVHWAHRVGDQFPDGQLYVNLRGFDHDGRPVTPADAIRGFLDALGVAPARIPTDAAAQAALYRSLIAGRRILILLDNARDADQVRPLLPGSPTATVVVTSRNQLISLAAVDGAHVLPVDLLGFAEARDLLAARLGTRRVSAEPEAVQRIMTASGRLPIALAIVAARAAANPQFTLADVARELDQARDSLDAFDGGDPVADVQAVFSWSYRPLSAPAARLFRLLGLHPGPHVTAPAAASLAALPPTQVRPLLAELTRINLITEYTPGRYALHDLLRTYATHLLTTIDPVAQRHAATHRLLDHYLHTAYAADRQLHHGREPITLSPPDAAVTPERFGDHRHALAWFTAEHPVLLAAVNHAATAGFDRHAWQLAWTLVTFLHRQGHWHDSAATSRAAVAASQRLADPRAQALAHRELARADVQLGRFDDAETQLSRALDLYTRQSDRTGQAHIHRIFGHLSERRGHLEQALNHTRRAYGLFRDAGHQIGRAQALNNIGWCHALLGNYQQALTTCRQALTLHQELGNRYGQANTWDSLGYAHHHLGHHTDAIDCYEQALALFRDLDDLYYEATILTHLGEAQRAAGNVDAARHVYQQALDILSNLDHPDADKVKTKLDGLEPPGGW